MAPENKPTFLPPPSEPASRARLTSWKSIAAFLHRDERTAQRWERERGLPVYRVRGGRGSTVFAFEDELLQWLQGERESELARGNTLEPVREAAGSLNGSNRLCPVSPSDINPVSSRPGDASDSGGAESSSSQGTGDNAPTPAAKTLPSRLLLPHSLPARSLVITAAVVMVSACIMLPYATLIRRANRQDRTDRPAPLAQNKLPSDHRYFEAMYLFGTRDRSSLQQAQRLMLAVQTQDPSNAAAWSALAQIDMAMRNYDVDKSAGIEQETRDAAMHAIALNGSLSDPYAVLGFTDFFWKSRRRELAEGELRKAIELDPHSPIAHSWYGLCLTALGRYPEALRELDTAAAIDPSSSQIIADRAVALGLSGSREEAVGILKTVGGKNPSPKIRYYLSVLAMMEPRDTEAIISERLEVCRTTHNTAAEKIYANAQKILHREGEQAMWKMMTEPRVKAVLPVLNVAEAQVALGKNSEALQTIAEAEQRGDPLAGLSGNSMLLPLHPYPEFQTVLAKQHLPYAP